MVVFEYWRLSSIGEIRPTCGCNEVLPSIGVIRPTCCEMLNIDGEIDAQINWLQRLPWITAFVPGSIYVLLDTQTSKDKLQQMAQGWIKNNSWCDEFRKSSVPERFQSPKTTNQLEYYCDLTDEANLHQGVNNEVMPCVFAAILVTLYCWKGPWASCFLNRD